MSITPEIISGFGGAIGIGITWALKNHFSNRNGHTKMTKSDHDEHCRLVINPIIERLNRGDDQFDNLRTLINENHSETVHLIMELKK